MFFFSFSNNPFLHGASLAGLGGGVLILWEHVLLFTAAPDLAKIKQRYGSSTPLSRGRDRGGRFMNIELYTGVSTGPWV